MKRYTMSAPHRRPHQDGTSRYWVCYVSTNDWYTDALAFYGYTRWGVRRAAKRFIRVHQGRGT